MSNSFRDTAEAVIISVLVFVLLQVSTQSYAVEGHSMSPTLTPGSRFLVNKFVYARVDGAPFSQDGYIFGGPRRGDVIVFSPPIGAETEFVKRVIGLPGDIVDIVDGEVYVNGVLSTFDDEHTSAYAGDYPLTVPEDSYFVLGDNRNVSSDSRQWGLVDADDIVGRAWFSYWPPETLRLFH